MFFILQIFSLSSTFETSEEHPIPRLHVKTRKTSNFEVVSYHGVSEDDDHDFCLAKIQRAYDLYWPNLVQMASFQRYHMAERFKGDWNCVIQLGLINYSVLRRSSIYIQAINNEYQNLRCFCFK